MYKMPQQNISKEDSTTQKANHMPWLRWILESQGLFNIPKSINVVLHQQQQKDKNHMIISIDDEKAFNKIQNPLMIKKKKNFHQNRYRGSIINTMAKPQPT